MICEPTWPAPPVTRIVRSLTMRSPDDRATDRVICEAQLRHPMQRVEIAAIDDDGPAQRALDPSEIRMTILVPVRDDGERVGIGERIVARRREANALAKAPLAFIH